MRLAEDADVLVLAEPLEVHRLPVDEELRSTHLNRPHTDRLVVRVDHLLAVDQLDLEVVQVAVARCPPVHVGHAQHPRSPRTRSDLHACDIPENDLNVQALCRHSGDLVRHGAGRALEPRHDGDVVEVSHRSRQQPDRPVQPGVVEEVVPVPLLLPRGRVLDDARRDGLERQGVVHAYRDQHLLARNDLSGHVPLERRVAALVRHDLGRPHPHRRPVRRRLEVQDDPLPVPPARHPDDALVPDIADVVMHRGVGGDVVEAGRHRHHPSVLQRPREPLLRTPHTIRIKHEGPAPVQTLGLTSSGVLGSQHGRSFGLGEALGLISPARTFLSGPPSRPQRLGTAPTLVTRGC